MRAAIVGAGLAGAAAARLLADAGHHVTVFEKSRGFGGRSSVRRLGPWTFDSGATSLTPQGSSIESAIHRWLPKEEVIWIKKPIHLHREGAITPGDPARSVKPRCAFASGMNALAKAMLLGLDVRLESRVETVEIGPGGCFRLLGEEFDGAILTAPGPQSQDLLRQAGDTRGLERSSYRRTLSILLAWESPFEAEWHALINPEQDEALTWMCVETLKAPGWRGPEGTTAIVAQLSRAASQELWDQAPEDIAAEAQRHCERLLSKEMGVPSQAYVHRWRFAQPETTLPFDQVNPRDSRLILAGDAVSGPRMELAFDSGLQAARRLV